MIPNEDREARKLFLELLNLHPEARIDSVFQDLPQETWSRLLELGRRQHLSQILYFQIQRHGLSGALSPEEMANLKKSITANALRNCALYNLIAEISRLLREASIEALVLKGPALASTVYDEISMRFIGDLDLLVREEHVPAFYQILLDAGFEPLDEVSDIDAMIQVAMELRMRRPNTLFDIEIHWALHYKEDAHSIELEKIRQRAIAIKVPGGIIQAFGHEDHLLHLCSHGALQHLFEMGLRSFCDAAFLMKKHGDELDWELVCESAASWNMSRALLISLKIVEHIFGISPPDSVIRRLEASVHLPTEVLETAEAQLFSETKPDTLFTHNLVSLVHGGTLWAKACALWRSVFVSKEKLAYQFEADPQSLKIYFCYLKRILYLLKNYAGLGLRIKYGEGSQVEYYQRQEQLKRWLQE